MLVGVALEEGVVVNLANALAGQARVKDLSRRASEFTLCLGEAKAGFLVPDLACVTSVLFSITDSGALRGARVGLRLFHVMSMAAIGIYTVCQDGSSEQRFREHCFS